MVDGGFVIQGPEILVIFAHNHSELAAGIAEDRGSVHALNILNYKRASGTGAIGKGLMLGKTVRVPRHIELSEPGRRLTGGLVKFLHTLNCKTGKLLVAVQGQGYVTGRLWFKPLVRYYFGVDEKCNFFAA
jgi:hypothetical protein